MNVYQTASNFSHTTNSYYHQTTNLLMSPDPSNVNTIYSSGQLINEDHFYTNLDNTNSSLIHMFIKNEQKNESNLDQFYSQNSTVFNSPSPSASSYNSSNGSGQIVNWTPNSQTNQSVHEESIVLCQLDDLTKSLNNQMIDDKKNKIINQNLNLSYNLSNIPTPIDETMDQQLALTNYDFNSNSIITQKLSMYNSTALSNDQLLIQQQQHQFNTELQQHHHHHHQTQQNIIQQQQSSLLDNTNNHLSHHLHTTVLSNQHQISNNNHSNIDLKSTSLISKSHSSTTIQSTYTPVSANNLMHNKLNQITQPNQLNCKIKQEPNINTNINTTTSTTTSTTVSTNNLLNVIIGYDSEGRPIRNTANKKERRRTLSINNAFSNLRDCIPNVPADTKLSKIKTLRLATSYISYLMELLDDSSPLNGKRNRLMMTCEDFKVDLQRFKGRSKNIHLIYPKFSDKQFNQKEDLNSSSNSNIYQQSTFNQNNNLKLINNQIIKNQNYPINIQSSLEQYDQTNNSKRLKGRTGWPQHVIKHVWASELHENSHQQN